jgi:hypothetical protein
VTGRILAILGDRRRLALCVGLTLAFACGSTRGGSGLEPRFVAVHNALAAMGMAQIGPIEQGTLDEGHEAKIPLRLPAGCVTIVAMGGENMRDVDAALLDTRGAALAHDTTTEPQAVLRGCLESADTYVLVVKAAAGFGSWVAATWVGNAGSAGPAASAVATASPVEAKGSCESPIPLAPGVVAGSTTRGEHENTGSCNPSDSRELVYALDIPARQRVSIDVQAQFDSVLYIRKDDCADPNDEVDCNDDAPDRSRSRIDRVLEPGKYFVFVDGYEREAGSFKMTVTATDVLALADVCRRAPLLVAGSAQTATTEGMADDAQATCGGGAEGADAAWRTELAVRSRLRVVEHSDETAPVVHLRRACADEQSEVACGESGATPGDAVVTGVFDAGMYTVFADARERDSAGRYTLLLESAPLAGSGAGADDCDSAAPLPAGGAGSVGGDTFTARDDVAGSCGGAGAPDVVYRLDVAKHSRLVASLDGEEAAHVLVVWRRCGERATEVACGRTIDEVLSPGVYFVAVDGASANAFGRFTLKWALRDLTAQGSACAMAPTLGDGRTIDSTTVGGGDKFVTACGGTDAGASGPDRVFKIVLPRRATVRLAVTAATFDTALALRKACADPFGAIGTVELACESEASSGHHTSVERSLEAGTYWVVVDGQSPNDQGPFTLEYRVLR